MLSMFHEIKYKFENFSRELGPIKKKQNGNSIPEKYSNQKQELNT